MSRITYIPSFDGLRAIAVFFVLIFHGSYGIIKGGWIGVDIFFVLSGYLITSILKKEYLLTNTINLKRFYTKRILRLLPALIVAIILCNILWNYINLPAEANRLIATLASVFYACNLFPLLEVGPLGVVWSLSVEEHFYFFWPLAIASGFLIFSPKKQFFIVSLLIAAVAIFRIFVYNRLEGMQIGLFVIDSYRFTFCRLDTILLGALLALIPSPRLQQLSSFFSTTTIVLITWASIAFVLKSMPAENIYWRNGGFLLTNLLCVFTVLFALHSPNNPLLSNKLTGWLGRRSYGIYLYHTPIFLVLEHFRVSGNYLNLVVVMFLRFAITLLITELSFRFIEQPVLRKFSPKEIKRRPDLLYAQL